MPKQHLKPNQQGITLIEVLVTIIIVTLFIIPFIITLARINHYQSRITRLNQAIYHTKHNLEVLANLSQTNWEIINPKYSENGNSTNIPLFTRPHHLKQNSSQQWQLYQGEQNIGPYTTVLTFSPICRHQQTYQEQPCSAPNTFLDQQSIQATSTTTWTFNGNTEEYQLESTYSYLF